MAPLRGEEEEEEEGRAVKLQRGREAPSLGRVSFVLSVSLSFVLHSFSPS